MQNTIQRMPSRRRTRALFFGLGCFFTLASFSLAQTATSVGTKIRTVALTDDAAPGLDGMKLGGKDGWPSGFGTCKVDGNGRVGFIAGLKGKKLIGAYSKEAFSNNSALFVEQADGTQLVVRAGDPLGKDDAFRIQSFTKFEMGGNGGLVASIVLSDKPRGDRDRVDRFALLGRAGANDAEFKLFAQPGDAAFGDPEGRKLSGASSVGKPVAAGKSTFFGQIAEADDKRSRRKVGVLSRSDDDLELVAMSGQEAPGQSGKVFTTFGKPALSKNGDIAFSSSLANKPESEWGNNPVQSLWLRKAGQLEMIAMRDEPAPDLPDDAKLYIFSETAMSPQGELVIRGKVKGPRSANSNGVYGVLYQYVDGQLKLIARDGGLIPGDETGAKFFVINGGIPNDKGQVAFESSWKEEGAPDRQYTVGIFSNVSGEMKQIAKTGAPVDPADASVTYKKFLRYEFISPSQIVVFATTSTNAAGIYISQSGGALEPLVQPGMAIEVRPGEERVLKSISYDGGIAPAEDSEKQVAGYVSFQGTFKDRTSGIFVVTIPTE